MLYRVATLEDCAVLTSLRMEMRAERDPGFCKEDLIEITHAFFQRNIQMEATLRSYANMKVS